MFCYQKNFSNPTLPVDEAQFYALVRATQWNENIDRYRQTGDASLKRKLPAFIFQATFDETASPSGKMGPWRKQSATRLTGLVVMDVDHVEDPHEVYDSWLKVHDFKSLGILLIYVTPSGKGLKIVFKARAEWGNLIDNQHRMAGLLGVEVDESCKDASRMSFICKEEDILFISKELFTYEDRAFGEKYDEAYRAGKSAPSVPSAQPRDTKPAPMRKEQEEGQEKGQEGPLLYHGIPYSRIVEAWLDGKQVTEGDRHRTSLILADQLRYITDNDAALMERILREVPFVAEIVRERNEDVAQTVKSAREYRFYKNIPQRMREALSRAGVETERTCQQEDAEAVSPLPPQMPKRLPRLIALLVSRTPDLYKPAVAHAVFPALATHLWKTRFRYIDNKLHEATLMNCLMAGTGAGKDCISEPIDHIMADIRLQDAENLRREKEWKDEVNAKGANKDKRKRPEGLVIQEIDADMTNPAFVMRMAEADGHFLYVKLNELDQFDALKGNGSGGQQFRIMCLAFDPNNRYGQTRIGTQSVTERVTIRFNWNATTTIQKGQRYFSRVLTDGPISRINFCTIPEREIGSEIPVYGEYDEAFDEELKPYLERLCNARGEIDCPQPSRLARKLIEECADFSRLSQSRVYENFSFRANVIAWLKACVLYVANGCAWDEACEDFIRWSLNYDLWCKMQFFGEAIETANRADERTGQRGPRNLLELLPDEFTMEDARRVRQQQGMSNEGIACIKMIRTWMNRGYVIQNTEYSFQKSDRFRKGDAK